MVNQKISISGFMKNKIVLFIILSGFCLGITQESRAQLIDTKAGIQLNLFSGKFLGDAQTGNDGFIYPFLFPNFDNLSGQSAKAIYKIHSLVSIGVEGNQMTASEWQLNNNDVYNGAEVSFLSIAPVLQIHTKFRETGIFNRLKISGELAPVFGQSDLKLDQPVFEFQNINGQESELTETINNYNGIKYGAGIEFAVTQKVGLHFSYSAHQNQISSMLYNDDKFTYTQASFGLIFRLLKDKRHAY